MEKDSGTKSADEIEITPEMIDAGEDQILGEVGGVEGLGGYFSARELACAVYRAMELIRLSKQVQYSGQAD
jgi:hypothetical protein